MAKKKKNKKNIPLPLFILICACLIFAIYISLSTIVLAIFGETTTGTITSYNSRLDSTDAPTNRSRTISKGYYFFVNDREYKGYSIYNSDEYWADLEKGETRTEKIRYLSFFPYINKPSMLAEFDEMGEIAILYHIIAPLGYVFLLILVIKTRKKYKKKIQKDNQSSLDNKEEKNTKIN